MSRKELIQAVVIFLVGVAIGIASIYLIRIDPGKNQSTIDSLGVVIDSLTKERTADLLVESELRKRIADLTNDLPDENDRPILPTGAPLDSVARTLNAILDDVLRRSSEGKQ